jgi:hypothetical protein
MRNNFAFFLILLMANLACAIDIIGDWKDNLRYGPCCAFFEHNLYAISFSTDSFNLINQHSTDATQSNGYIYSFQYIKGTYKTNQDSLYLSGLLYQTRYATDTNIISILDTAKSAFTNSFSMLMKADTLILKASDPVLDHYLTRLTTTARLMHNKKGNVSIIEKARINLKGQTIIRYYVDQSPKKGPSNYKKTNQFLLYY